MGNIQLFGFMGDLEEFNRLLDTLPENVIQHYLLKHISDKRLHSDYIKLIVDINKDYIDDSNWFIERMKRDVNAIMLDEQYGHKIFKDADITDKNWFWYARIIRDVEDEKFPKRNYFKSVYLLKRVYDIIIKFTMEEVQSFDEERRSLYNDMIKLSLENNLGD